MKPQEYLQLLRFCFPQPTLMQRGLCFWSSSQRSIPCAHRGNAAPAKALRQEQPLCAVMNPTMHQTLTRTSTCFARSVSHFRLDLISPTVT